MYVSRVFDYAFTSVDFTERQDYIVQRLQQLILKWSCKYPERHCENEARRKYIDWASKSKGAKLAVLNLLD